jgi:hypothetical protein
VIKKSRISSISKFKVGDEVVWLSERYGRIGVGTIIRVSKSHGYSILFGKDDRREPFLDEELRLATKLEKVLK